MTRHVVLALVACRRARRIAPTVRPREKGPPHSRTAPLHNRKIAFGRVRFAWQAFSHRSVPRGPLRSLRFARALSRFAPCAASLRKLRFLRRISPQSEDCVRARPFRVADLFASVRSACGGDTARGGTFAGLRLAASLHSSAAHPPLIRHAPSIRESGAQGLVGNTLPSPCIAAFAASGAHRRRIRSGPVAGTPPSLPAV